jgi:hypothetical protein
LRQLQKPRILHISPWKKLHARRGNDKDISCFVFLLSPLTECRVTNTCTIAGASTQTSEFCLWVVKKKQVFRIDLPLCVLSPSLFLLSFLLTPLGVFASQLFFLFRFLPFFSLFRAWGTEHL